MGSFLFYGWGGKKRKFYKEFETKVKLWRRKRRSRMLVPSFDRRDCSVLTCSIFYPETFAISLLVESIPQPTNGRAEPAGDQSRSRPCDITWLTSTNNNLRRWRRNTRSSSTPTEMAFHFLTSFLFFSVTDYYYDLIHQRDDVKNAIDLPRKRKKEIEKESFKSGPWGAPVLAWRMIRLVSFSFYPSFFLSPFVRSFVQPVAPLSRNTHTHTSGRRHTHTRIIRWQVLTVRPFSSGLDVLTCTSRFFLSWVRCRVCVVWCGVCVCAASRGLRPEISYGIWLC